MTQREFSWRPDVLEKVFANKTESEPPSDALLKLIERVKDAIESLPEREREVIELYFYGRMSQREIARYQHCAQKNIWRVLQRAQGMLAGTLESALDDYLASR